MNLSRVRNALTSLFVAYFVFGSAVLAAVQLAMHASTDEAYRGFKARELREEVVRLAAHMQDRQITQGPLAAEQTAWLERESALRHLYVRFVSAEDAAEPWYDALTGRAEQSGADNVLAPLVVAGETHGFVQAAWRTASDEAAAPESAFARERAAGERWVWIAGLPLVALAAFVLARRSSAPLRRAAALAGQIRRGDRETKLPVTGGIAELQVVAKTLNELTAQLEKQEGIRAQLTQDLTHEFRTPITTMTTELEAVMDGIYPMDEARTREMYAELERLTRLIDDVEQLFDAEGVRFKLDIARHEVVMMMQGVCRNFQPFAREKGIALKFEHPHRPVFAELDHDRVIQIVLNLLTNALKFTDGHGDITLGVEPGDDGRTVAIYCEDRGIGIAPDDLPRIFDRFFRANRFGSNRKIRGLGVGLSICKALAEAHDGTIEVHSTVGKGSRFTVTLPAINKQD